VDVLGVLVDVFGGGGGSYRDGVGVERQGDYMSWALLGDARVVYMHGSDDGHGWRFLEIMFFVLGRGNDATGFFSAVCFSD
jgi:hypothetical protein